MKEMREEGGDVGGVDATKRKNARRVFEGVMGGNW